MIVTCRTCQLEYDDLYKLTYCPHETFEMHTLITVHGIERCCHSIEELDTAIEECRQ
jgi:hypothetical protein